MIKLETFDRGKSVGLGTTTLYIKDTRTLHITTLLKSDTTVASSPVIQHASFLYTVMSKVIYM